MDSMIDSLFDQYERGGMTRRHLVQALAALVLPAKILAQDAGPAPTPIVRGLGVNHVGLTVSDIQRSFVFYQKLFGVTKGWPATNAGTGIHPGFARRVYQRRFSRRKKGRDHAFLRGNRPYRYRFCKTPGG
jgi:hypothetical protein